VAEECLLDHLLLVEGCKCQDVEWLAVFQGVAPLLLALLDVAFLDVAFLDEVLPSFNPAEVKRVEEDLQDRRL
jgi:hypothetical protein